MKSTFSEFDIRRVFLAFLLTMLLALTDNTSIRNVEAQGGHWSSPRVMPGFDPDSEPPILISDQRGVVHAFTYQWVGDEGGGRFRAIVYNQWTLDRGWTNPIDILLSPSKEARLTDVYLDDKEIFHLVFWGGDNTGAGIYYSRADMLNAGEVHAWDEPLLVAEDAGEPQGAVLVEDNQGNLLIMYHGRIFGNGVYTIKSLDGGVTWSRPVQIFFGKTDAPLVDGIQVIKGRSGWFHAVWNTYNETGQGRGIYYSRSQNGNEWSDPLPLAITPEGLGVRDMTMIEHGETILVTYVLPRLPSPKFTMRTSIDDGITWRDPSFIFPRHVGANGPGSLVVDGDDGLHIFFGQRISGSPDIHGMWHSTWINRRWTEPEALVKGPQVSDPVGDKSFDPNSPRAVVSQGNVVLVTWRTDRGLKENGVWYSYKVLDAPELPANVPTLQIQQESTLTPTSAINKYPDSTPTPFNSGDPLLSIDRDLHSIGWSPGSVLALGAIPAIILILVVVVTRITRNKPS